jgi:hypothetical protein
VSNGGFTIEQNCMTPDDLSVADGRGEVTQKLTLVCN